MRRCFAGARALILDASQQAAVDMATRERVMVLTGGPGSGKCVREGSLVLCDRGLVPIETIVPSSNEGAQPMNVGVESLGGRAEAASFYNGGKKQTVLLRTARGFEIEGTCAHPVLVARDGGPRWAPLSDIEVGDYVGLRIAPHAGGAAKLQPDLGYLMGVLIGDGSLSLASGTPVITKSNLSFLVRMGELARVHLGANPIVCESRNRTPSVRLRGGRAIDEALARYDVPRCTAAGKYVPSSVLRAGAAAWAAFVRGLFDCDGHVDKHGAIEWTTASERLSKEVQIMLGALGIWATRRSKPALYNGEWRIYWRVTLSGADVDAFRERVGLTYGDKAVRLAATVGRPRNTNLDVVPQAGRLIREAFVSAGPRSRREWRAWKREVAGARQPSRARVANLLAARPDTPPDVRAALALLSSNEIRWDKVEHAAPTGESARVYDLTVPGARSFVANGVHVHNTTVLRHILDAWEAAHVNNVLLCAPTGKAAKRMTEATGQRAATIHRLLNADTLGSAGAVVIDESSMVDTRLLAGVLGAISRRCRVLFIGDADQLPSIGAGQCLRDILDTGTIPVARLTEIHRQSENSWIAVNADRIVHGKMPHVDNANSADFFWSETPEGPEGAEIAAGVTLAAVARIADRFGLDPLRDITVLAPKRKEDAPLRIGRFNEALQAAYNGPRATADEWVLPDESVLRVGDRVRHTVNDYEIQTSQGPGVFNGETGHIVSLSASKGARGAKIAKAEVDLGDRVAYYDHTSINKLVLGYAMTIHASQGSGFPGVVVVVHDVDAWMLSRPLLYTALTRAEKVAVIVGSARGLAQAVRADGDYKRVTRLKECLLKGAKGAKGAESAAEVAKTAPKLLNSAPDDPSIGLNWDPLF